MRNRIDSTEHHERMLTMLASRIAAALVNAQLYARVFENERRMDREMKIARAIQQQLMPEEVPSVVPLDIAVTFRPVAHLGGDLYDFIHFDDGRLAFVVGDVAGKGAPGGLCTQRSPVESSAPEQRENTRLDRCSNSSTRQSLRDQSKASTAR